MTISDAPSAAVVEPLPLTVWYDVQCPYSDRVLRWLDRLGPARVRPTFRVFSLEQVNHDPDATTWRLWEQPLDYAHYRGRPDRRSLAAFLTILLLEATASPEAVDRYRLAVSTARHVDRQDISKRDVLLAIAARNEVDPRALAELLDDPDSVASARERIRSDWLAARSDYQVFGVPTLRVAGAAPYYLRLEHEPGFDEALGLLATLRGLPDRLSLVQELKVAEPWRAPSA